MSRTVETTLYKFDELSDEAKEKAREWYRAGGYDYDWWSFDDYIDCAKFIGIGIDNIYFSGFSSQGDGACFEGRYEYKKGGAKALKAHAPNDKELARIADGLQELQRKNFYRLSASVRHRGHYNHEMCTVIDVENTNSTYRDCNSGTEEALKDLLRDYMRWIYRQLEEEWEYLNADEQVDDNIRANEYEFEEDGARA